MWRAKLAARERATLLAIASTIACGSLVTSRDFPKRRACSQAESVRESKNLSFCFRTLNQFILISNGQMLHKSAGFTAWWWFLTLSLPKVWQCFRSVILVVYGNICRFPYSMATLDGLRPSWWAIFGLFEVNCQWLRRNMMGWWLEKQLPLYLKSNYSLLLQ